MEEKPNKASGRSPAASRLWLYRKRARLGQKQLAYLMGFGTATHVSEYEVGAREPTLANIIKLELLLHVPIHALYPEMTHEIRAAIHMRQQRLPFRDRI